MSEPSDQVALCLSGAVSPQVAIARLMLGGADAAAIRRALDARRDGANPVRFAAFEALLDARGADVDRLSAEIARTEANHAAFVTAEAPDFGRVAAFFDNAVAYSPEAGVALHSLGDPAILAAATAEIVDWIAARGLVAAGADVLDLGCGAGRVAAALAPLCRSVLGLDVSAGMVAEARRRCAHLPGLRFEVTDGLGLDMLAPRSLDLILAVDSFPYVVQAGPAVAERHVAGAARALRGDGALVLLNMSYGRDPAQDRADVAGLASRSALAVETDGERPFVIWDAAAFVLRLRA